MPTTIEIQCSDDLARCHIVDPVVWTPDHPATYTISFDLERGSDAILFGLRKLETAGRSLYLDQRRWVARSVTSEKPVLGLLEQCRNARLAVTVVDPSEEFCRQATEIGVMILLSIANVEQIVRFARWPCIGICIVENSLDCDPRTIAPNILFFEAVESAANISDWAVGAVLSFDCLTESTTTPGIPIYRPTSNGPAGRGTASM